MLDAHSTRCFWVDFGSLAACKGKTMLL